MNNQDAVEFVMNHIRRVHEQGIPIVAGQLGINDTSTGHWELMENNDQYPLGVCAMGAVALGRKHIKGEGPVETVARVMAVSTEWRWGFMDAFDFQLDRFRFLLTQPLENISADAGFGLAAGLTVRQMCALEGIEVRE